LISILVIALGCSGHSRIREQLLTRRVKVTVIIFLEQLVNDIHHHNGTVLLCAVQTLLFSLFESGSIHLQPTSVEFRSCCRRIDMCMLQLQQKDQFGAGGSQHSEKRAFS
jgi:hypothetical protein